MRKRKGKKQLKPLGTGRPGNGKKGGKKKHGEKPPSQKSVNQWWIKKTKRVNQRGWERGREAGQLSES